MTPTTTERRDRLIEASSFMLSVTKSRRLMIVNLNKALFYLDLVALRDFGNVFTGSAYVAIQNGPVVSKYKKRLVGALERSGVAEQIEDGKARPVVLRNPVIEFDYLSRRLQKAAVPIVEYFDGMAATEASEFTHRNLGWQVAWNGGLGKGRAPRTVNMLLAMQQIVDSDPWMQQPFTTDELASMDTAGIEAWPSL